MCTLSWLLGKDSYSLIFNRDELNSRQRALPPTRRSSKLGAHFLSPTDTDTGGSWLMVNEYGFTACLLNFYGANQASNNDVRSRGDIVLKLTDCRSIKKAESIVQEMNNRSYNGFDLVLFDSLQGPVQYRWNTRTLVRHFPVIPPLTSSSYCTDEVCRYRRELFSHAAPQNLQQLSEFHNCHYAPYIPAPSPAHSPCMHRSDAKTVSQCVVEVNREQVAIRYLDGNPCRSELSPPLILKRVKQERISVLDTVQDCYSTQSANCS